MPCNKHNGVVKYTRAGKMRNFLIHVDELGVRILTGNADPWLFFFFQELLEHFMDRSDDHWSGFIAS